MKKSFLLCTACGLALALLLAGCVPIVMVSGPETDAEPPVSAADEEVADEEDAWDGLDDDWSAKEHYWQVLDASGEEAYRIDREKEVETVDGLTGGGDGWKRADAPENDKPLYTYVFMQQKTLLAGQNPDGAREYDEVMRFTVYEDSNVLTMVIANGLDGSFPAAVSELVDMEDILTIHAEAPADTAEALRSPQQFTE